MCGSAVVLMGVGACAGDCLCAVEWDCVGGVFVILCDWVVVLASVFVDTEWGSLILFWLVFG